MALYPGMADPDAASDGTRFRVLDDGAAVDEERLAGLYGYPTGLSGPWVRANVIAALDGGAVSDGKSGGLGGPGRCHGGSGPSDGAGIGESVMVSTGFGQPH